jgi:hypothetical protein
MATPDLRILHFNDVYHIEPRSAYSLHAVTLIPSERDPVGGAARFVTVINEYRNKSRYAGQPDLLILFSGDAFNPSIESTITKVQWHVHITCVNDRANIWCRYYATQSRSMPPASEIMVCNCALWNVSINML